jgi:iron complex outermembrane recepter protein
VCTSFSCNHRFGVTIFTFLAVAGAAANASQKVFSIESEDAARALLEFQHQSASQTLFLTERVAGVITNAVHGSYEPRVALRLLLKGTSLVVKERSKGALLVEAQWNPGTSLIAEPVADGGSTWLAQNAQSPAAVDAVQNGNTEPSAPVPSDSESSKLAEVIVTAQKREERIQDVPMSLTALNVEALENSNQFNIADYFSKVPGVNLVNGDSGTGLASIAIRGIAQLGGNPTVAFTVDDVPFGGSGGGAVGEGGIVPDFDPSNLSQIEILRGPQGTLYGANGIGGTIRYVTVDPSTAGVSGRVEVGTSEVYNGSQWGYNFSGELNVPLSDTLAMRISGFNREVPGYVDNIQTGQDGINQVDANGGRFVALWSPSQDFSLKLGAMFQGASQLGYNYVDPTIGDFQQDILRGAGYNGTQTRLYDAILKAKLGTVDLTAVSGYSTNDAASSLDFTPYFGQATQEIFGVSGTRYASTEELRKFTQEVRLSASVGDRLDWLVGVFYDKENTKNPEYVFAEDGTTGETVGTFLYSQFPTTFDEYAGFLDLTYHFSDRLDLQIGGRESQNTQSYSQYSVGPWTTVIAGQTNPFITPEATSKDNSFTYLVTPRFKVSPDMMVYGRVASGYVPGGPNSNAGALGVPLTFGPENTTDYEVGTKGNVLGNKLSFDVSLFYIDYRDIQLAFQNIRGGFTGNGAGAKSEGVEFSVESRPMQGMTVSGWIAFDDAKLTEDFPPDAVAAGEYGIAGDRLPSSSPLSGNVTVNEQFPLTKKLVGLVQGSVSYVGGREGLFTSSAERQYFGAYAQEDAHAGVIYDSSLTVNLFVTNIGNTRGILDGGLGTFLPAYFTYIRPRSFGVNVSKKF